MSEKTIEAASVEGVAPRLQVSSELNEIVSYLSAARCRDLPDSRVAMALVPAGLRAIDLESFMPNPKRVRRGPVFTDTSSFVEYFNAFKKGYQPRVFSKSDKNGLFVLCVFDYDGVPVEFETEGLQRVSAPVPMWGDHTAQLVLKYAPDYADLLNSNNKWFSQQDFALFVEENTHLFTAPSGADMLELAQELKGSRNVSWQSGKRLSNSQTTLEYVETISAQSRRGSIDVPEVLTITTPIFDKYAPKTFNAAFRWRMTEGGKAEFGYRLLTKLVEREAVDEIRLDISDKCGMNLLNVSTYVGIIGE